MPWQPVTLGVQTFLYRLHFVLYAFLCMHVVTLVLKLGCIKFIGPIISTPSSGQRTSNPISLAADYPQRLQPNYFYTMFCKVRRRFEEDTEGRVML